jgi:hypothetical protein
MTGMRYMNVRVSDVKVRQVDMQVAEEERKGAKRKSNDETNQIQIRNGHKISPAFA